MISFLAVAVAGHGSQSGPPTLDPTYGKPIPRNARETKPGLDAKWIWASETQDKQTVVAKRVFQVNAQPKSAVLFVAVDNYMQVRLDGKDVGRTTSSDDDMGWEKVQRFDLTSALNPGSHTLEIEGKNSGGPAGIIARLQINGKPALLTDKSWEITDLGVSPAATGPATEESILGEGPWGAQIQGWPAPLSAVPNYLHHLPMPAVAVAVVPDNPNPDRLDWHPTDGSINMDSPTPGKPWRLIFDFSRELSGRVSLTKSSNLEGTIGCGESTGEALEKPYTTASIGPDKESDTPYSSSRYTCVDFPAETKHVTFKIGFDHLYYPVVYRGGFDSSDPLLNKIWYTGAYTAHLCMQQDIWDAPKRDRARWMGDLHVSGEVINNAFLDRFLMEQTISRLRADAQGGRPEDQQPGSHVNGIPGYSCAWLAGLRDLYYHTGDLDYIKSQHQAILSLIEFMKGEIGEDGVFANRHGEWPFVDWSPDFDKDTPESRAATHLFDIKAAQSAVELLNALGDTENANRCATWKVQLVEAAQKSLVGPTQTFGTRRQENAMAVYAGVATPAEREAIYQQVLNPENPDWKQVATPYYNNYIIAAVSDLGHDQEVMNFVRNYWGGMIGEGATSFWEAYDTSWDKHNFHIHLGADDGVGYFVSLCHGWSAGVTSWLTERILGITPTSGGFATCRIEPHLADLQWVSGTVPTPNGAIKARFERTSAGLSGTLTIPSGTAATVDLGGLLSVDGQAATTREAILTSGRHRVETKG